MKRYDSARQVADMVSALEWEEGRLHHRLALNRARPRRRERRQARLERLPGTLRYFRALLARFERITQPLRQEAPVHTVREEIIPRRSTYLFE